MKKIALFLSIVVAAIACEQVDPVTPPEFDFANPDVVIPYQGSEDESLKLEFKVNLDWTAELDNTYDWLQITPKSGKAGDASITVIATPNTGAARNAVITVKAGVSVLVFDVCQEGYPSLEIEPTELNFAQEGGTQTVTVNANVEYVVDMPENDWLSYTFDNETSAYTIVVAANEGYAPRSLTLTLSNNVDAVSEAITVSQVGRASLVWEKSLADMTDITLGNPIHVAYKDGYVVVSTGAAVYTLNAEDGSYVSSVPVPDGFVVSGMASDDAGNIVLAQNVAFGGAVDVYAISSLENPTPVKVATLNHADVYSNNAGNVKAGGDVTKNGVVVMIVDVSQYYIACDIVDGVAGATQFGALDSGVFDGGTLWDVNNGCVVPLGSSIADGFLATYYPCSAFYSNAGGAWAVAGGSAGHFGGNDNMCSLASATYDGVLYAAVGVGAHFNYTSSGAFLYDLTSNQYVYGYTVGADFVGAGATSDVVLISTDEALYMYYVDLGKATAACVQIK